MSDDPDNIILVHLRRFDTKLDRMAEDMADIRQRLTTVEIQIGQLVATEQSHYAQIMLRMDRHDARFGRIERRLDLTESVGRGDL